MSAVVQLEGDGGAKAMSEAERLCLKNQVS